MLAIACRETVVRLQKTESALVRSLQSDSLLMERMERLMTIPAVAPITALTWVWEVGDVQRFSSIKKAISYCGLCGAENKLTPVEEIKTEYGAKTMGIDSKTQNLILVTSDFTPPSGSNGNRKTIKGTARILVYGH